MGTLGIALLSIAIPLFIFVMVWEITEMIIRKSNEDKGK